MSLAEVVEELEDLVLAPAIEVAGRLVGQEQARARWPGRGRWRRAGARRPRGASGGGSGDGPGRPDRSATPRARRAAGGSSAVSNIGTWTFSTAVKVARRWNDWKTKPTSRRGTGPCRSGTAACLEVDLAFGRPVEAAEQVQERALAASAGPDDRDRLVALHLQRHPSQCLDVAIGIDLAQPVGAEQRTAVGPGIHSWRNASLGSSDAARTAG